jgi:hypothetical protein
MELQPVYVDVIAKRWAEFTGQKPVLEASGESFEVVARQRGVATA